ncbi:DMT family transporter [Legionella sp. 27cVA30]|uniref:DMT family transporter n=1 Tax=Legionella sp. 27cVA30 TaxID=2905657 RepID=UPI00209CCB97|nr:EamA family transporter [Legionella sp. 27cVA30]MCP0914074.1 DMT family transporter [Legionella sp. 27cVA30]
MESLKVRLILACAIFFWGSAYVGIRIGLASFSPGALALFRFFIASIIMFFIYRCTSFTQSLPWRVRMQLIIIGMIGIGLYNICLNYGELTVSAGIASFIVGLMPVITLLFSIIFLKERPAPVVYVGISISLLGLLGIALAENIHHSMQIGICALFCSAVVGAFYTIILRPFLRHYHPIAVSAWTIWGGMMILLMYVSSLWHELGHADHRSILAALYIGIFPAALAYMAWSYVLNFLPASRAVLYLYAAPLVAMLLGFFLLQECPSLFSLAGCVLALLGALLASCSHLLPFAFKSRRKLVVE